jgi:hypothetical protein
MNQDLRAEEQSEVDAEAAERRAFLKKVGKASAAAPAVALLMAAHMKPANAQAAYGGGSGQVFCTDGRPVPPGMDPGEFCGGSS